MFHIKMPQQGDFTFEERKTNNDVTTFLLILTWYKENNKHYYDITFPVTLLLKYFSIKSAMRRRMMLQVQQVYVNTM